MSRLNSAVFVDVKQGGKPVESMTASLSLTFLSTRGILGCTPSCARSVDVVYSVTPSSASGRRDTAAACRSRASLPRRRPWWSCLLAFGLCGLCWLNGTRQLWRVGAACTGCSGALAASPMAQSWARAMRGAREAPRQDGVGIPARGSGAAGPGRRRSEPQQSFDAWRSAGRNKILVLGKTSTPVHRCEQQVVGHSASVNLWSAANGSCPCTCPTLGAPPAAQ